MYFTYQGIEYEDEYEEYEDEYEEYEYEDEEPD